MKTSHEAAQKKVWKKEIRDLEKQRTAAERELDQEVVHALKAVKAADKQLAQAHRRVKRAEANAAKRKPRVLADIDSRLAVLRGRVSA